MHDNTLPPFEQWARDRPPNRNRMIRVLARLIVEHADALAETAVAQHPGAVSIPLDAVNGAALLALRAEYDALKEAAEGLFPTQTPAETHGTH